MSIAEPSPEVRAVLRKFCEVNEAKFGPDWKAKLAAQMAERSAPVVQGLIDALRR